MAGNPPPLEYPGYDTHTYKAVGGSVTGRAPYAAIGDHRRNEAEIIKLMISVRRLENAVGWALIIGVPTAIATFLHAVLCK